MRPTRQDKPHAPVPAIGAITLVDDDLGAANQFYPEVFGLPVTFEDDDPGGHIWEIAT